MEESLNSDDLRKCDKQYQITIGFASSFNIGERVFLKSNPEVILTVITRSKRFNLVEVITPVDQDGMQLITSFPPQSILPYRYAGLVIWKGIYLSLN